MKLYKEEKEKYSTDHIFTYLSYHSEECEYLMRKEKFQLSETWVSQSTDSEEWV
jgi:hypothetical protein